MCICFTENSVDESSLHTIAITSSGLFLSKQEFSNVVDEGESETHSIKQINGKWAVVTEITAQNSNQSAKKIKFWNGKVFY